MVAQATSSRAVGSDRRACALGIERNLVDPHRRRDILDLMLAQELVADIDLGFELIVGRAGYRQSRRASANCCKRAAMFTPSPCRSLPDDHVAEINPDADAIIVLRKRTVALLHLPLNGRQRTEPHRRRSRIPPEGHRP